MYLHVLLCMFVAVGVSGGLRFVYDSFVFVLWAVGVHFYLITILKINCT